ncbi:helical backbone metal receptor [Actinomadura viridis]|uniref:ABC-type Fe3+-hydroxamate transport system substrate-binding protein n=1 Tax=Actinomadura viridis TaxID=58110 RepID=A0A931GK92_9ACTN|nr:helical backbone metal receptor [Actinomadura viridis]MBG6090062.1 ABC-type Fe3+-hydroxamate transport system substrate-binding protein [Actinomadura viridis]
MPAPGPGGARAAGGPADDTGAPVPVPGRVRRVVSLVPSLTETIAVTAPGLLAGATDWCTHPAGLDVPRVRGTKNPDLERIAALRPDLVVGNTEENRAPDVEALRAAGIPVWMTEIRTVEEALVSLRRMLTLACGVPAPDWLDDAARAWRDPRVPGLPAGGRTAIIPIWRRPWMVVGRDTFTGDVLARLGIGNRYAGHPERYPKIPLGELNAAGADLVVLPDEPYRFTAADGPESFPGIPSALVTGRHLTWYGPSLVEAPGVLARQLADARLPGGRSSG